MVNWIKGRVMERTSWDGGALIAVGLVVLFGIMLTRRQILEEDFE